MIYFICRRFVFTVPTVFEAACVLAWAAADVSPCVSDPTNCRCLFVRSGRPLGLNRPTAGERILDRARLNLVQTRSRGVQLIMQVCGGVVVVQKRRNQTGDKQRN